VCIVRHDRRQIQHIAVTLHPTAEWLVQQLRETTPFGEQPTYLLHDNGAVFISAEVRQFLRNAGMKSARIAYRSPWQNGIAERTIGILRHEVCDHLIPINAGHLQRLLNEYVHDYYNPVRTHQGIDRQTPLISTNSLSPGPLSDDLVAKPVLGGLYHTYRRAA